MKISNTFHPIIAGVHKIVKHMLKIYGQMLKYCQILNIKLDEFVDTGHYRVKGMEIGRKMLDLNFFVILSMSMNWFLINWRLTLKCHPHKMVKHTQTIRLQQSTNCLSVFDRFVGFALKGFKPMLQSYRDQSNDLHCKFSNLFLDDRNVNLIRVNENCLIDIYPQKYHIVKQSSK